MLKLPGPHDGLKIGLFGGSFNPAHDGHFHVAETTLRALNLDWIWWLVARGNPLKSDHGDFESRYQSAVQFADPHPKMRVSDIEIQAKLNYSADVLPAIMGRAPRAQFVWVMGGDSLANFHKWRNWQLIAQTVPIVVVARPGAQSVALSSPFAQRFQSSRVATHQARRLPNAKSPAWAYLPAPLNRSSSTQIRGDS